MSLIKLKEWPLRRQIILALLLAMLLVVSGGSWLTQHFGTAILMDRMHQHIRSSSEFITASTLEAVIVEDVPVLESIISQVGNGHDDLLAVEITNTYGNILLSWKSNSPADKEELMVTRDAYVVEGESFGNSVFTWSLTNVQEDTQRLIRYSMLLLFVTLLLLTSIIALLIQGLALRPIQRIKQRLDQISAGNLQDRLETASSQEISLLTHSVNDLARMLDQREKLLEEDSVRRRQVEETLHEARDQAEQARYRAEEASEAKSAFLATMSHEIRTPMSGVLGMGELLAGTKLDEEQREYLDSINSSGQALLSIINNILDFSKIEAHKIELESIPFDLEHACHEVVRLLTPHAQSEGLELVVDYPSKGPRQVIGDAGRIRQILTNLIGNAIKFTKHGHVILRISCSAENGGLLPVQIEVEDTGIGINPAQQDKLFDAFTQADGSTTRKYGGTGLGLSISKQLVDLMGGRISVESLPDKGATFRIELELPIADVPEPLPQADLAGVRILVVDHECINRQVLSRQLQSIGMEVVTADSGSEALQLFRENQGQGSGFHIALLDLHMSDDMDSNLMARNLRAEEGGVDLSLVLLSSTGQKGDARRSGNAGFDAYLSRPVLFDTLRQTLASVLGVHQEGLHPPLITRHCLAEASSLDVAEHGHFSGQRVLVVEDVLVNRKIADAMLSQMGLTVVFAEDGVQAIDQWRSGDFDLILMDCQMPVMDGYEASRKIREQERQHAMHIPIIALTANATEEDRRLCEAAGMDDFVTKPFTRDKLITAMQKWLPVQESSRNTDDFTGSDTLSVTAMPDHKVSAIDLEKLDTMREMMGEDFGELISAFLESVEGLLADLPGAYENGAQQEVLRIFHSIKSASGNVGAVPLSSLAAELEEQTRSGLPRGMVGSIDALHGEFARAAKVLASIFH